MSHVDDGELTAYADGAYPIDDPMALRIAEHLFACGNCRARLEQNQQLRGRAAEILGYATPLTVTAPDFDALRAQVITPPRRPRAWPLPWAASIILALGLGWFGRGMWQSPPAGRGMADGDVMMPSELREEGSASLPQPAPSPAETQPAAPAKLRRVQPEPQRAAVERELAAADHAAVGVDSVDVTGRAVAGQTASAAPAAPPAPPPPAAAESRAELARARAAATQVIPGLPVTRVETIGETTFVEQSLPDGKIVRLAIRPGQAAMRSEADARKQAPRNAQAAAVSGNSVTVIRDGKTIMVSADVAPDSLGKLAEKIRD